MKKYQRIIIVITDSLGIGGDKRAYEFGDKGANTLLNVSKTGLLKIPTWKKLGIDAIAKIEGFNKAINQKAYMARMVEISNAKDTLSGHWEMMGIKTEIPYPNFAQHGFPQELIKKLSKAFDNREIIGNKAASGTDIINELAHEEIENNKIIVYTSSDSVLQICGHEKYMGLDKLYEYAKKARAICDANSQWKVGRIIARPYVGEKGNYTRTSNRHDYAVQLPKKSLLEDLEKNHIEVIGIGKINDIFNGKGITKSFKSISDANGMDILIDLVMKKINHEQLIFVNLVDFDSKFGHRRDPEGYAKNINLFDIKLAKLINAMNNDDLLLISSDHGNDPTFKGTDHTREHVPLTIFAKNFTKKPKKLNDFIGFGSLGNIVAKNFNIPLIDTGEDRTEEIE